MDLFLAGMISGFVSGIFMTIWIELTSGKSEERAARTLRAYHHYLNTKEQPRGD